jgi:hypothetical protein
MKTIVHLNASSLKSDFCCARRWYLTVVEGYRKDIRYNDTEYGSAFHRFISTWKQTGDLQEGLQAGQKYFTSREWTIRQGKKYLTKEHLYQTCMGYWCKYEKDEFQTLTHDGKPLVELKFAIPYYTDDHVEILLEGTIDDLCKNSRGCYAIRDYKTSAKDGDDKIDDYLRGYELSTQLMYYTYAVQWYAQKYPNSIFAEFAKTRFACFIDGIFLCGAAKPATFARSDMIWPDKKMEEFERLLQGACRKISGIVKAGVRPDREGMINGYCFGHFKCPFFGVCSSADDMIADAVLAQRFIQVPYEPLKIGVIEEV